MSLELAAAVVLAVLAFFFGGRVERGKGLRRARRVQRAVDKARSEVREEDDEALVDRLTRYSRRR